MGGERERLVLVTRFSDLRAGDLVVVKPCGHCGKTHKGMLVGPHWANAMCLPGDRFVVERHSVFAIAPTPRPCTNGGILGVGEATVARREVYRVDTGLSHTTETEKELEATR